MSNRKNIAELYKLYEDKMQDYIVTDEFSKLRREIINKTDTLNKDLTDEQKILMQDILELEHQKGALEDEQVFIYGYRLAIKLFLSGLLDDDKEVIELCKKV